MQSINDKRMVFFWWTIDGKEIKIYFSLCNNGSWIDWDYDESNPPFKLCRYEKEDRGKRNTYYTHYFYSGVEFNYIDEQVKIVMKPKDLYALGAENSAKLLQVLNLPCELPDSLKRNTIDGSLWWSRDKNKSMVLDFNCCENGRWTDLDREIQCKFQEIEYENEDEDEDEDEGEDEDDLYYYIFNSGIEFTYLDHRIVMTSEDLESLHDETASMLLQVLDLNAT